jgi:hypothetical protein
MILATIPHVVPPNHDLATVVWANGMIAIWFGVLIITVAYLLYADKINAHVVYETASTGLIAGVLWPAVFAFVALLGVCVALLGVGWCLRSGVQYIKHSQRPRRRRALPLPDDDDPDEVWDDYFKDQMSSRRVARRS